MKNLKQLLDFYINSSLHVAFAIYSLVRISDFTFQYHNEENVANTVFFGTIVGYNFLKYFQSFQNGNFTVKRNRSIIGMTLLSLIITIFYFLKLPAKAQIFIFWTFCLVVIYPFLRKQGWIKLFWVSFCMAEITVHFPSIFNHINNLELFLLVLQRFFIVFALLIPFEILDSEKDDKEMKTIPQRIGIFNTKMFGFIAIFFFLGIEFLKPSFDYISLLIGLITLLAIWFSSTKRNQYYTYFWVECIPILWFIFYLILI